MRTKRRLKRRRWEGATESSMERIIPAPKQKRTTWERWLTHRLDLKEKEFQRKGHAHRKEKQLSNLQLSRPVRMVLWREETAPELFCNLTLVTVNANSHEEWDGRQRGRFGFHLHKGDGTNNFWSKFCEITVGYFFPLSTGAVADEVTHTIAVNRKLN